MTGICLVLYEKRFGLLQKDTEEEALTFIAAIKTVSRPLDSMSSKLECRIVKDPCVSQREIFTLTYIFNT